MWLGELDEPETRWLLDAESGLIHQLSGQLLFISQHTLYTQGFDIARLAAIGNRSMVADNVAAASVSDTGIVAYRSASVMSAVNSSGSTDLEMRSVRSALQMRRTIRPAAPPHCPPMPVMSQ